MMPTVVSICFELQQKMSHNHCLTIMKIYVYCHMTSKKNQYFLLALDLTWITDKCYSVLVSQNDIFRRLEFLEQANLLFMMSVMQCFAIETGLVNQVTRVSCSAKKKMLWMRRSHHQGICWELCLTDRCTMLSLRTATSLSSAMIRGTSQSG